MLKSLTRKKVKTTVIARKLKRSYADAYLLICERARPNITVEAFTLHVSASMDAIGFRQESWNSSGTSAGVSTAIQGLAEAHYPLTRDQARHLLILLDRLVDMGDRRAAALQQSEHFRSIQIVGSYA